MGKLKDLVKNTVAQVKTAAQNASQNVKQTTQNASQSIKQGAQNAAQAAKTVAQKAKVAATAVKNAAVKAASVTTFVPLKPLAVTYLKKRGITPAATNEEIISQVYAELSKKSFGLADSEPDLFTNPPAYEVVSVDSYGFIPITPEMVIAVIQFLKVIFDAIKAKKAKGEVLSSDEQAIMDKAPEIEQGLSDAKDAANAALDAGEAEAKKIEAQGASDAEGLLGGGSSKWIIIIVVVIIIALILFKKFK